MNTKETLLKSIAPPVVTSGNKMTVVGAGQVGMAVAISLLTQVIKVCTSSLPNTVDAA